MKLFRINKGGAISKTEYIRIAAIIAIAGNAILASLKIIVGIIAGSGALLGDGIDSSTDVLIGIMALVIVRVISKPADAEHPWGHGRAETVATAFLSFILFFAGAQLIIDAMSKILSGRQGAAPSAVAIAITIISIIGKMLLAWCQSVLGRRADSAMIKANAKNMTGDVLISVGVLIGLAISSLTGSAYADTIAAILIGAWIIKTAVSIFLETNLELMDGSSGIEPYRVIAAAVNSVEGASHPHRARMRKIAGFWDIDLDIDVDPGLTVQDAHSIASKVESEIKSRLDNVFDIMIHIEPRGDDTAERYGLSEDDMRGEVCELDDIIESE